jgi:hypothetical protein
MGFLSQKKISRTRTNVPHPNGGYRAKTTAKNLKAEGVKAGVSDILLPVARSCYHGLFIELKNKNKRSKATKNQKEWLEALSQQGFMTAVCHGWEQASEVIKGYLELDEVE